jgi:hypothetical protein
MPNEIVIGLYRTRGTAEDVRNRLVTMRLFVPLDIFCNAAGGAGGVSAPALRGNEALVRHGKPLVKHG